MRTIPAFALTLFVAACGGTPQTRGEPANRTATPVPTQSTPAAAPPAQASKVEAKTDDYSFAYAYPAQAAAIVPLKSWLDGERDKERTSLTKDTTEARREAEKDGFPYRPYESTTEWKVVTDTPRFLSLSSEHYIYSGGAHGMTTAGALIWDKQANARLSPTDLFRSPAAIQSAIGDAFCRALDTEREKRRGEPVTRGEDPFTACPKVAETTLILGSTDRRAIDRLGVLVDPYVAGAYAEGSFDLTLPVTAEMIEAVKPEFRDAFAPR